MTASGRSIELRPPGFQSGSDLVIIAQEGDVKIVGAVVEKDAQSNGPTALEGSLGELADAQAGVEMRLAEVFG